MSHRGDLFKYAWDDNRMEGLVYLSNLIDF